MLLLRQACQPLLDDKGFTQFHVEIDHNKNLAIKGECGQTIVSLSGISFTKRTITSKERDFAISLFTKFLDKNHKKLQDFVKVSKITKDIKRPRSEDYPNLQVYGDDSVGLRRGDGQIVRYSTKGLQVSGHYTPETFKALYNDLQYQFPLADKFLDAIGQFKKVQKDLQEVRAAISSCDI